MQWISGLSDIPGNEKADTLAKQGSRQEQRPTHRNNLRNSQTDHQIKLQREIAEQVGKEPTGKAMFRHMPTQYKQVK